MPATTASRREIQRGRRAAVVTAEAGDHRHDDTLTKDVAAYAGEAAHVCCDRSAER